MDENIILLRKPAGSERISVLPSALVDLGNIVTNDLCNHCGSCLGICPANVLARDENDYPAIQNLSACINCRLCVKVCPGDEVDFPKYYKNIFDREPRVNEIHGYFQNAYLGHATNELMRQQGSSGGIVTAIFSHLLETGAIDGAVVMKADDEIKWRGCPAVVSSIAEIIAAAKSKYVVAPTNEALAFIRNTPGRYAIVGLPCQIHGARKMMSLNKPLQERIVLTMGLLCHSTVEHYPLKHVWALREREGKPIDRLLTRQGKARIPLLKYQDQSTAHFYFPKAKKYLPSSTEMLNVLFRLFTPARCFTCFDATSELADISVGDPWIKTPKQHINLKDGYSFVLARTAKGCAALNAAQQQNKVNLHPLSHTEALQCNAKMAVEKRNRAFYLLKQRAKQNIPIPRYNITIPQLNIKDRLKVRLDLLTHYFCFHPAWRLSIFKLALSPLGYCALWLNHLRRGLKNK